MTLRLVIQPGKNEKEGRESYNESNKKTEKEKHFVRQIT